MFIHLFEGAGGYVEKMKVKYLKNGDKKATFVVSDIDFTRANAIRRALMTYVPSMAVDRITMYENTSPIYEEMLAHRIGLIPLTTDLKTYSVKESCKCGGKGCARCESVLILEKAGPGIVYSGDLKPQDSKIKPVYDKMVIVKMREGQKVKMEMVARLGFMSEHAKYQAVIASYKQLNDNKFEFFVESYNNLSVQEIIETGMATLEKKVAELEDAFSGKGKSVKTAPKAKKATKKTAKTAKKGK